MNGLTENIDRIRAHIKELEARYGREPGSVQLLAVSKKQTADRIREAAGNQLLQFGESYVQEAMTKLSALQDLPLTWHFIGPIQSNKTRDIAGHFDWVQSVDREKIAHRLNNQRDPQLGPLNICLQVNISGEASKSGVAPCDLATLAEQLQQLPNLRLRGLMAIPEALTEERLQRQSFQRLRELFERMQTDFPAMDTLSMGMSNDYESAIAEGSTLVRLGTALFGPR